MTMHPMQHSTLFYGHFPLRRIHTLNNSHVPRIDHQRVLVVYVGISISEAKSIDSK